MPQRKLIVGCGYLGRRVAEAWLREGHQVFAVTRSSARAEEFRQSGLEPILADVTDPQSLERLPTADTVLCAVGYDRSSGKSQHAVTVGGVENVLRAVAPGTGRFLYISSTSVYGQSEGEWVDESSPCHPVRPGGEALLEAEQLVWEYCPRLTDTRQESARADGAGANVLRLAGIYGPGRLLAKVETLRAGLPLGGRPDAWLNLIHLEDAVAAVLACEERGRPGETYLVCDDRPLTRGEYYRMLAEFVSAPEPAFDEAQPPQRGSGGLNKRCSNRKLRDVLQLELKYPTAESGLPASLV